MLVSIGGVGGVRECWGVLLRDIVGCCVCWEMFGGD